MRDKILELIDKKPKHYVKMIGSQRDLLEWVNVNSLITNGKLVEKIYSALYQVSNQCSRGNQRKFLGVGLGFGGCGPANRCQCVKQQVSKKVKQSKSQVSSEQQLTINQKRKQTNLQKYGVACSAQTDSVKEKFRQWYADPNNVTQNLERIRKTNLERYGVENCKSLPETEEKIIATCLARYDVKNVAQIPSTKAKLRARTAEYKLTGHLIKLGYGRFKKYIEEKYNFTLLTEVEEYSGCVSNNELEFKCNDCGTTHRQRFYYSKNLNCNHCNPQTPKFTSNEEQEIFDYITNELCVIGGEQGNRTLINPYEIDMLFPNEKITIEYCGLYWHSESSSGKKKDYHYKKMQLVNQQGYRLITIFSDEWNQKNAIVKSKLANIFGKTKKKYHARKLSVQVVSSEQSKEFLNQYHLQGNSSAKINLGLYNGDELLALMTFSNGRAALNTKSTFSDYELVRFVTNGSSIAGGAGKLLKHFITVYQPRQIVSYSDLRWSEGNLYKKLGFTAESQPTVGYWYVDSYENRLHRFNFTKRSLVSMGHDPSRTEWEIMESLDYDRIWDCGHQKFVLTIG